MFDPMPPVEGHPDCRIVEAGAGEWAIVYLTQPTGWLKIATLPCEVPMEAIAAVCAQWKGVVVMESSD